MAENKTKLATVLVNRWYAGTDPVTKTFVVGHPGSVVEVSEEMALHMIDECPKGQCELYTEPKTADPSVTVNTAAPTVEKG